MGKTFVIVGGCAGGASAAARLRRLDETAHIIVFERGPHISTATCGLPYYVSGEIASRSRLLIQTPDRFRERFTIDVRIRSEVLTIDRVAKRVRVRDSTSSREYHQDYDKLILSPGGAPVRPPLPGIDHPAIFTLRSVSDAHAIRTFILKHQAHSAVVVGGGFIGLEMTENLRHRGLSVTLIEMAGQVMLSLDSEMAEFIHQHLQHHGVDLRLGEPVEGFQGLSAGRVQVRSASGEEVECDLVLLAIGVKPEVILAEEAGLEIGSTGGISVDDYLQTSDPDIYAIGDAIETRDLVTGAPSLVPLAGPANRQGRIVADTLCGRPTRYPGALGTSVVRIFDLSVARTGAGEGDLTAHRIPYLKSYTHPASHAGYYPGATYMLLKLLFSPEDGRVLGAQIVGVEGVDKRIDVLATAIAAGLTVGELTELELCYAPSFGTAKDGVNVAGYVASNVLHGDVNLWHAHELDVDLPEDAFLLDCRTRPEYEAGHIAGALNIPIHEVRQRHEELPREKTFWVYCLTGIRSYFVCRVLSQLGYQTRNVSGGYVVYCAYHPDRCAEIPGLRNWKRLVALETFCSTAEVKEMLGRREQAD